MLRAIIFDFDGVIATSEPIHLAVFQRVLGEKGYVLTREEYYADYLGYDDRGCFEAFLTAHGQAVSQNQQGADPAMTPGECLVIEDSLPGIRGAHAAGMKVLAVANTHRLEELQEADAITTSLADVKLQELTHRLWGS